MGYRPQHEKSRIDKALQVLARSRVGGWLFITVFPVIDRRLIPLTRGRLKVAVGQPVLLLHTRGARSGQPRTSPLLYTPRGEGFVIVASKAGAAHNPAWYHNLRAHPDDVAVDISGRRIPVRPRVAEGAEREEVWQLVNDNYNGYQTYQERAGGRTIPVVLLERTNLAHKGHERTRVQESSPATAPQAGPGEGTAAAAAAQHSKSKGMGSPIKAALSSAGD